MFFVLHLKFGRRWPAFLRMTASGRLRKFVKAQCTAHVALLASGGVLLDVLKHRRSGHWPKRFPAQAGTHAERIKWLAEAMF
jgi:hypothetical protein